MRIVGCQSLRLVAAGLLVGMVAGCGVADGGVEPRIASGHAEPGIDELVRRLPDATVSVMVVDVDAAAEALGAERAASGRRADLPAAATGDGVDPDGQLGLVLTSAISPLTTPFESAHEVIDLGQVTQVVRATMTQPHGAIVLVATAQASDELAAAYTDAGFEAAGETVYLLRGASAAGDGSGGLPAVQLTDGLVILASDPDLFDRKDEASGPPAAVLSLLSAAGERWASSIQFPPLGAASCGDAVAIVSDGEHDELLLLDAGDDRFDRQVVDELVFEVGEVRADGEVTRYPLATSDPTPAALVLGNVLPDSPPLTSC